MELELLEKIQKVGTHIKVEANQALFNEGDECQNFVIVTKGSIKVFKTSESGKEMVLYRVNSDNLCVLTTSCMIGEDCYSAMGKTESEVEAILLNREVFDLLIVESKEFRKLVFSSLSKRFNKFIEKIDEVVFYSLRERLEKFICENVDANNEIHCTHQEIALELGTEREVVSRLLSKLKLNKKIEIERGQIKLL